MPDRMRHIIEENKEKANRFIYIVPYKKTKGEALGGWPGARNIIIPWDKILLLSIGVFVNRIKLNDQHTEHEVNALIQSVAP